MVSVLLDTTFLLPTLGVEVEEIKGEDFEALKNLSNKAKLHCSYVSFVEIFGKLAKEPKAVHLPTVQSGIRSLLEAGTYTWINPSTEALEAAFQLRVRGHRDNIDNIVYSIALTSKMLFLSLDQDFKKFLNKNGYDTKIFVRVRELEAICK